MSEILVSVIVPSLNVAEYIDTCMESVIKQTLFGIEVLCIDAGSTDGTYEKLLEYSRQQYEGKQIELIHSDKKSYGYQVNLGIRMAKGKYIAVLESDDYADKRMYEILYKEAENSQCDFVKADYEYFIKASDNRYYFEAQRLQNKYNVVTNPSENLFLFANDYNIWKGIYNRDFLRRNSILLNETNGAAYQDIGFSMQVLSKAERALYLPDLLYKYRRGRDGASVGSNNTLNYIRDEFDLLLKQKCNEMHLYRAGIIERLVVSFLGEYNRLIGESKFDDVKDAIITSKDWFAETIARERKMKSWPADNTDRNIIDALDAFLENVDDLDKVHSSALEENCEQKETLYSLFRIINNKEVIIFGAGKIGNRLVKQLLREGIKVIGMTDNNSTLWGTHIPDCAICEAAGCESAEEKIQIWDVERAVKTSKERNAIIIIANSKSSDSIYAQLSERGISSTDIVRFTGKAIE